MNVTVRSFAKINLGLRIGPARADGFHELLTVYQTIALHDVLRVSLGRGSGIEIRCSDPRVPRDESNTCFRVATRAMEAVAAKARVIIDIEKRLPVQGGLGGASANAVATLLGLERALKKTLPATEKLRIAAEVGSDLPLFLVGGTVLGIGRGEQVYPLPDLPAIPCVVLTPQVGVSTPKAFAEWDRLCRAGTPASEVEIPMSRNRGETWGTPCIVASARNPAELHSAGQPGSAVSTKKKRKLTVSAPSDKMDELGRELSAWLSEPYSGAPSGITKGRGRAENSLLWLVRAGIENDFEQVVFPEYPELGEAKSALVRAGAKYASLSGSGSALYGLFASRGAAARAVIRLRNEGWTAQATVTLPRLSYWNRFVVK